MKQDYTENVLDFYRKVRDYIKDVNYIKDVDEECDLSNLYEKALEQIERGEKPKKSVDSILEL